MPHPGLGHALRAALQEEHLLRLKELNHFQLGDTVWSQRLPGFDAPAINNHRPYDILRIVMPAGPAEGDVKSLNAMMAQYLAAAVGPAGFEIAASDVDALSKMVGPESIGLMRPLFSTMGIAALDIRASTSSAPRPAASWRTPTPAGAATGSIRTPSRPPCGLWVRWTSTRTSPVSTRAPSRGARRSSSRRSAPFRTAIRRSGGCPPPDAGSGRPLHGDGGRRRLGGAPAAGTGPPGQPHPLPGECRRAGRPHRGRAPAGPGRRPRFCRRRPAPVPAGGELLGGRGAGEAPWSTARTRRRCERS